MYLRMIPEMSNNRGEERETDKMASESVCGGASTLQY